MSLREAANSIFRVAVFGAALPARSVHRERYLECRTSPTKAARESDIITTQQRYRIDVIFPIPTNNGQTTFHDFANELHHRVKPRFLGPVFAQ